MKHVKFHEHIAVLTRIELIQKDLKLNYIRSSFILEGISHNLNTLTSLTLGINKLSTMQGRICQDLSNLANLNLRENKISVIQEGAFRGR